MKNFNKVQRIAVAILLVTDAVMSTTPKLRQT